MLPTVIPPGFRLEKDSLVFNEKHVPEDAKLKDDKRTMEIITELANNISENIEVTYDIPSNYEDGKIPILDVKAGINEENKIEFTFYRKPVTNPLVTLKSSALPMNQKMTILTQQCFSRLHNTSEEINDNVKVEILNTFMKELKASEYTEKDRENILKGAVNTYKNIKTKEILKERPFYRDNSFEKFKRKIAKSNKKANWFKGKQRDSNYKSVLFVEATPGETLLKLLKETEERYKIADDCRIKLVSKSGSKISNLIVKKDPFAINCNEDECPPCGSINPKNSKLSKCRTNNVTYQGICKTCNEKGKIRIYDGETARNLHIRSKEHMNDFKKGNDKSWMIKHVNEEHDGNKDDVKFTWKVKKKHFRPLERQVYEAVNINNKASEENLNSKHEFNYQTVKRINLENNPKLDCKVCGSMLKTKSELNDHMKLFHERLKCNQCEYVSYGLRNLDDHQKIVHSRNLHCQSQ